MNIPWNWAIFYFSILLCIGNSESFFKGFLDPSMIRIYTCKFTYYSSNQPNTAISDLPAIEDGKKVYFIIHGYDITSNGIKRPLEIKDALFENCNDIGGIVIVDWSDLSAGYDLDLYEAAYYVKEEIKRLNNKGSLTFRDTVLTGHSLGAHLSGVVGKLLKEEGHTIGRIEGIDPAGGIGFGSKYPKMTLMKGDAEYVWILHTNSQNFGIDENLGDEDISPYGGKMMPECSDRILSDNSCSHGQGWDYYRRYISGEDLKILENMSLPKPKLPKIPKPAASVLVLDISPSMYDYRRMENLIISSRSFVKGFPKNNYLGIVVFGGYADKKKHLTLVQTDSDVRGLLDALPKQGQQIYSTSIGAGLKAAIELVSGFKEKGLIDGCPQFILISDGEENTDPRINQVQPALMQLCARVDAVALGAASRDLEDLVAGTKGSTYTVRDHADDASDRLLRIFQSSLESQFHPNKRQIRLPRKVSQIGTPAYFNIDEGSGKDTQVSLTSKSSNDFDVYLTSPTGASHNDYEITTGSQTRTFKTPNAESGLWCANTKIKDISGKDNRRKRNADDQLVVMYVTTFADTDDSTPVRLEAYISNNKLVNGEPVQITAHLRKGRNPILNANVTVILTSNSGMTLEIQLLDNGAGADDVTNDGIYSRLMSSLPEEGRWDVNIVALHTDEACLRLYEELDDFFFNEESNTVLNCDLIGEFERETAAGAIKVIGVFDNIQPLPVKDLEVIHIDRDKKEVGLEWTATGNSGDEGKAESLILFAFKVNKTELVDTNGEDYFVFGPNNVADENSLEPKSFGEMQEVTAIIPNELWIDTDDDEEPIFVFGVKYVSTHGLESFSSNKVIASFAKDPDNSPGLAPILVLKYVVFFVLGAIVGKVSFKTLRVFYEPTSLRSMAL